MRYTTHMKQGILEMKLLLNSQRQLMRDNSGHNQRMARNGKDSIDYMPVLKLFTPWGRCTWLLTEIDADGDTMFGLCDLGQGCPELGYVSLAELQSLRGPMGLTVERDMHFVADKSLAAYAREAQTARRIAA